MKYLALILSLLLLTACGRNMPDVKSNETTAFIAAPTEDLPAGKNALYCSTFGLAWAQIKDSATSPILISAQYPDLRRLNAYEGFATSLRPEEYKASVKIDTLEAEIEAAVEFSKALPFALKMEDLKNSLTFKGTKVEAFGLNGGDPNRNSQAQVVYYKNDHNFLVKLFPKDTLHEIFLYRNDGQKASLQKMFDYIATKVDSRSKSAKEKASAWRYDFAEGDVLVVPKIAFNLEHSYENLIDNGFKFNGMGYDIIKATQRTAFMLDEEGAKVESEALIAADSASAAVPKIIKHPKKLFYDKPFLIVLKRKDSPNPYFALWVDNAELLVKE